MSAALANLPHFANRRVLCPGLRSSLSRFEVVVGFASEVGSTGVHRFVGASLDAGQFAQICRYRELASAPKNLGESTRMVIALSVILIGTSLVMVLLVLLHKGKGGGLSDLFGGGVSSTLGSSSVVERNLDRITIFFGVLWFVCIVALGWLLNH